MSVNILSESNELKLLEGEINSLNNLLSDNRYRLKFPENLEEKYLDSRLRQFTTSDIKIVISGLLIYLTFGWADFYFGGESAGNMFMVRILTTIILGGSLLLLPVTPAKHSIMPLLALGIMIVFVTVALNSMMTDYPAAYFYHLGMVPVQVFCLLALRLSFRCLLSCSACMLISYIVLLNFIQFPVERSEIDELAMTTLPYIILFWATMIAMGAYLSFYIEVGARRDYIKNRLLALEAKRLQFLGKRLHELSTTDGLTGISNRRSMEEVLDKEWRRCLRSAKDVSVIMLDIDAFKVYNDQYGHQKGDECLRQVARAIESSCRRPADYCARYGGEEFIILLPDTSLHDALGRAELVRQAVLELEIQHEGSPHGQVTISIGVASMRPSEHNCFEDVIKMADQLLYRAKNAGRNCVHVSPVLVADRV